MDIWLAVQQKLEAYPIDGHICSVMNPIQWRDKWCGLWEVLGQRGLIQHVSIVLNTIDMTGCRHTTVQSFCMFQEVYCHHDISPSLVVAFRWTSYLFYLFKCQRILRFDGSQRWEGVQETADITNLLKSLLLTTFCTDWTFINIWKHTRLLFSRSQSHRRTWELQGAWVQKEYL